MPYLMDGSDDPSPPHPPTPPSIGAVALFVPVGGPLNPTFRFFEFLAVRLTCMRSSIENCVYMLIASFVVAGPRRSCGTAPPRRGGRRTECCATSGIPKTATSWAWAAPSTSTCFWTRISTPATTPSSSSASRTRPGPTYTSERLPRHAPGTRNTDKMDTALLGEGLQNLT